MDATYSSCPHCPTCGVLGERFVAHAVGPLRLYRVICGQGHDTMTSWRVCAEAQQRSADPALVGAGWGSLGEGVE